MVSQPDTGEQALNVVKFLMMHGAKLIVVDSAAALAPEIMFEKDIGDCTVGVHAKLMSEGVRTLNALLKLNKTTIIFTNQLRCMIGNGQQGFTTPGGRALRFYASQRIDVKRVGSDKQGEQVINNICVAKVAKNKIAPPFMKAQFKITFGRGIDPLEQVIDYGLQYGMIKKGGAWFEVGGNKCNGHKQLYDLLATTPDITIGLEQAIVAKLKEEGSMLEIATNLHDMTPDDVVAMKPQTAAEEETPDIAEMVGELNDEENG
jgi:recombination protein RecA